MPVAVGGIILPQDVQPEIFNDVSVLGIQNYVNEFPVITRLMRDPVDTVTFLMRSHKDRPRLYTLGAAIADGTVTTISLTDASPVMVGDVFEQDTERIEVIDTARSNSTLTANQLTIRRAAEGTTAAAHAATANAFQLVGNSRTGGEVNQAGIRMARFDVPQYCQTWQFPVQVSGSVESSRVLGVPSVFQGERGAQLRNLYKDMENTTLYGIGEAPSASNSRPKQKGLKSLIITNKALTPTNAGAYKPVDFLRDTLEKCRTAGGQPDVLLLSANFMTGLATWGQAVERIDAGKNVFGLPIDTFAAPFLGGVTIVETYSLKPFTAVALTSQKVRWRNKRNEFWNVRGNRGDAIEAEWIAEGAVELIDEAHHAWVEGISAFSAT